MTLSAVNLPADDVSQKILAALVSQKDLHGKCGKEHTNYTPKTHIDPSSTDSKAVVMNSSDVMHMDGPAVHSSDQMASAVQSLHSTI